IQKPVCSDSIVSNPNSTASLWRLFQQHRPNQVRSDGVNLAERGAPEEKFGGSKPIKRRGPTRQSGITRSLVRRHSPNERYGKSSRSSAETSSLRLDVSGPDHLAPLLGFLSDQLAELDRRSRQRRAAEVSETGLHLRIVENRVDLL